MLERVRRTWSSQGKSARWASLLLAAWFVFQSAAVCAQPAPSAAYQRLIDEGIREYRLRNFAEARSLLARAYELYPNARALRGIGMAEFELRHYRESANALADALAHRERPLDDKQRREVQQLLGRAENFLTHVTLKADPWPTAVLVDGEPVALTPGGELVLEVGDHTLEFAAPGHLGERRQVRAVGGEWLHLQIALLPLTVTPFAVARHDDPAQIEPAFEPPAPVQHPTPAAPDRKKAWIWSLSAVALAALAAGLGFGLSGRDPELRPPIVADPIAVKRGP